MSEELVKLWAQSADAAAIRDSLERIERMLEELAAAPAGPSKTDQLIAGLEMLSRQLSALDERTTTLNERLSAPHQELLQRIEALTGQLSDVTLALAAATEAAGTAAEASREARRSRWLVWGPAVALLLVSILGVFAAGQLTRMRLDLERVGAVSMSR